MAVWMIAWANIKRKKGVALSMGILILLAVALFNVGITLLSSIEGFYDRENKRMGGADYMVRFSGNEYKDEYLEFFQADNRVEKAETEEVILMDLATIPGGGAISCTFRKENLSRTITGFDIEDQTNIEEGIYIPSFFRKMGVEKGETFQLKYKKQNYFFPVLGYSTSTWFHSSVSSMADIFITQESYDMLYSQIGGGYLLTVCVKEGTDIASLQRDFKENTDVKIDAISQGAGVMSFSVDEMRTGCTMLVTIISAILFAFSTIIVIVIMIVIRFRISNHIEDQMQNIGALKAVGYTGRQLQWSIALEFLAIGGFGTVFGILASYGILCSLGGLITDSMGIAWRSGIHMGTDAISVFTILASVLLVSVGAAGKVAGILPVKALRGGVESHNFERNHLPLEHTTGSLSTVLGLKSVLFHGIRT